MTTEQQRHLILAAMVSAQERAMADGEPGGAEDEIANLKAMLDDPDALAEFFASLEQPAPQVQESRQGVDLEAGQPASRFDLLEAVGRIADAIQHRKPTPKMTELIRDQRGLIAGWRVVEQEGAE